VLDALEMDFSAFYIEGNNCLNKKGCGSGREFAVAVRFFVDMGKRVWYNT
jgi:hypothetical protein